MSTDQFAGTDRRHHQLYVTRNTEYHLRDGEVIAVRDRARGGWIRDHKAIGLRVMGLLRGETMVPKPGSPSIGDRMYLADGALRGTMDLVTSMVLAIERPPREVVAEYETLAA